MRLCIIGNSHIGCFKWAWPTIGPESERFRETFFGAPHKSVCATRLKGNALLPVEDAKPHFKLASGGLDRIRLDRYDAYLLVGLGFGVGNPGRVYEKHRLARHALAGEFVISEACMEESTDDALRSSPALNIARMIRSVSAAPIVVSPTPQPLQKILSVEGGGDSRWSEDDVRQYLYWVFCRSAVRTAAREGISVFLQPEETLRDGFTRWRFGFGAERPADYQHMKKEFGHLILSELLPLIRMTGIRKQEGGMPAYVAPRELRHVRANAPAKRDGGALTARPPVARKAVPVQRPRAKKKKPLTLRRLLKKGLAGIRKSIPFKR
jgi:hypothetical protein